MAFRSRALAAYATALYLAACGTSSDSMKTSVSDVRGPDGGAPACVVFGAHRQLCEEESFDLRGADAEALPFYACFEGARCGVGTNGRCTWQTTPALVECLQRSEPPPGRRPHADFHVHWDHPEKARPGIYSPHESLAYIDAMGITSGMLITNTYMAHRAPAMTVDDLVDVNREYSQILARHPRGSSYQILCGVSFQRDDAVEVASRCLQLPKVRGIKLRGFHVRRPEDLLKFEALVSVAHERGGLVLSHFAGFEDVPAAGAAEALEDTQKIVAIMGRFPAATLVIAHSGFSSFIGWPEYAWIGEHYRNDPSAVRNVYTETSDSFADFEDGELRPDTEGWVRSWRAFGLDRVMFGSDYPAKYPWVDGPLSFLATTTAALSPSEAAHVVRLTGDKLAVARP